MKNKLLYKAGAVIISLGLCAASLSACGGKDKAAEPTPAADENKGDTTVSKFDDGRSEPSASAENSAPPARSAAPNGATETSAASDKDASALAEARSFFEAGMYDDAREMLESVDRSKLTPEQTKIYDLISESLKNRGGLSDGDPDSFTAEEAINIAEYTYGVTLDGDPSELNPQTDANGMTYYTMQIRLESENLILTVNVYSDGSVDVLSSEPIAYG